MSYRKIDGFISGRVKFMQIFVFKRNSLTHSTVNLDITISGIKFDIGAGWGNYRRRLTPEACVSRLQSDPSDGLPSTKEQGQLTLTCIVFSSKMMMVHG